MFGFLLGLLIGLGVLLVYRTRYDAKLKSLLGRIQSQSASVVMPYESQIASAIATQTNQVNALNAQIDDFRQILAQAPIGYLYIDEENRLLWCNAQAQKLLAIEQPPDFDPPRLLLAVVRSYELDHLVEQTRQRQGVCQQDWTLRSISPDPANLSERPAYPLRGYGVSLRDGHVGIFLENRQEAMTLAQQRDRWTSDVAHELKTPLTSIRLVGETLRSRIDPSLSRWIDRLLNEVSRLSTLVDDLLNLSQLERLDTSAQSFEDSDLVGVMHQAWQSLEPLANLNHLSFKYSGPLTLMVEINVSLMYRVFLNLLDNAIKHSPTKGVIEAKVSAADHADGEIGSPPPYLLIEIIDAGCGFTQKDLPHIFDRFYRADPARARLTQAIFERSGSANVDANAAEPRRLGGGGSGLGLSIVNKIVAAHEGCVVAENHPDSQGAWLKIWLPGQRVKSFSSISA
ncbi:MAG: PAS domain-containing sensor histidine kinase [Cyanobacteria bacterium P01_D01_bin.44]